MEIGLEIFWACSPEVKYLTPLQAFGGTGGFWVETVISKNIVNALKLKWVFNKCIVPYSF